jgi:hypothetical protein
MAPKNDEVFQKNRQCFKQIEQIGEDQWELIRILVEKFTPVNGMQRVVWLLLIEAAGRHVMNGARKMMGGFEGRLTKKGES